MAKLKLAILGAGDVAQRDYLPELYRLESQVELVAVCARHETRARTTAEQYGAARWYTDCEEMLRDPEIQLVANLTPIQQHFETTLAALRAGKHVYTEKPLATEPSQARILAAEADTRGLKLVCAPCVLLFPQVQYAQARLREAALGEIWSARAYGHGGVPPWAGYASDPSPFFARGAGPAVDMGVYPLHALTGLLGPVRRVFAMSSRTQSEFVVADGPALGKHVPVQVDDNWHMLLDFGGGRLASVQANNCVQDSRAPQLELFGHQGTLALNLLDVGAPVELLQAGADWQTIPLRQTGRASGPDHLLGIAHLVECVQSNREPLLSAKHAIHVLDVLKQAEYSARAGCAQPVTSTF